MWGCSHIEGTWRQSAIPSFVRTFTHAHSRTNPAKLWPRSTELEVVGSIPAAVRPQLGKGEMHEPLV